MTITVVDKDGGPLAGLNVLVKQPYTDDLGKRAFRPIQDGYTDTRGEIQFETMEGEYNIFVSGGAVYSDVEKDTYLPTKQEITMLPITTITANIYADAEKTVKFQERFSIIAVRESSTWNYSRDVPTCGGTEGEDCGRHVIEGLNSGTYIVTVRSTRRTPDSKTMTIELGDKKEIDLVLLAEGITSIDNSVREIVPSVNDMPMN